MAIGHALNYLADEDAIDRALVEAAGALRPGGALALDLCDLSWGKRPGLQETSWTSSVSGPSSGWAQETWAVITRYELPTPTRFGRHMTTFIQQDDGAWRRDDETHWNVLIDTSRVPALLDDHGVDAILGTTFDQDGRGGGVLTQGLATVVGHKRW